MAAQIQYRPLDNLGINGLNTQSNPATLDPTWLTAADNIVLRESGKISFRKGLKQQVLSTSSAIGSLIEHKDSGTNKIFAAVGTNIYTVDFSTPDSPWTGTFATTGSDSDWQFINFNKGLYGFQDSHTPIKYTSSSWAVITTKPSGVTTFDPSCGSGYYGRNWVGGVTEEKDVIYYSDTLQGDNWTTGASGYIDLKTVWGTDEIVAIAPFYGKLVIFGKHNIAIYNGPTEPTTMELDEVIRGVGCVSRDSVQSVGDDLYFCSNTGVRSLHRTSQLDKLPLVELSSNITDAVTSNIRSDTDIKAVYDEGEGLYIMTFVDIGNTYVFDTKVLTPNKAPRITSWSFTNDRQPTSYAFTESKDLLIGQKKGSVATYEGYYDKDYISGGTYTNAQYISNFSTVWIDLGNGAIASILKKFKAVIDGGEGTTVSVKWYKDFSTLPFNTVSFLLNPTSGGTSYKWGSSTTLFGAAKYAPFWGLKEYNVNLGGSAKHLKIEMSANAAGYVSSLQDLTLLYKGGKIR
jgi:hypothetical protein